MLYILWLRLYRYVEKKQKTASNTISKVLIFMYIRGIAYSNLLLLWNVNLFDSFVNRVNSEAAISISNSNTTLEFVVVILCHGQQLWFLHISCVYLFTANNVISNAIFIFISIYFMRNPCVNMNLKLKLKSILLYVCLIACEQTPIGASIESH